MKILPVYILAFTLSGLAWGVLPVTAAVCDAPPLSQSLILFSGGCDRQVLPCTQGFIMPALPSTGGDFPSQYFLDFGDGSPPYYGRVDGVTHVYTAPGHYTLTYMAGTACDLWHSATYLLEIPAPQNYTPSAARCEPAAPRSDLSADPVSGPAPLAVRFTVPDGADAWVWRFGDGGRSMAADPVHTYTTPGLYTVSLDARDSCSGAVSHTDRVGYITVKPASASLAVSSVPDGAAVFIDNVLKGITPLTLNDIPSGRHMLLLTRQGYDDYTRSFTTEFSGATTISATLRAASEPTATPGSSSGSIAFTSVPSGAVVSVDGTVRGTAPLVITALPAGVHQVTLSEEGYDVWNQAVQAGAGQTVAVNAILTKTAEPASSLAVTSDPSGAEISVDGAYKGIAPLTITGIAAGTHSVSARAEGYTENTTAVSVAGGEDGRVFILLQKVHRISTADIVLAAAVILMLLLIAGIVMLRQDTGR